MCIFAASWLSDGANRLEILRGGFDPQSESITFGVYAGWLLTGRPQFTWQARSQLLLNFEFDILSGQCAQNSG